MTPHYDRRLKPTATIIRPLKSGTREETLFEARERKYQADARCKKKKKRKITEKRTQEEDNSLYRESLWGIVQIAAY